MLQKNSCNTTILGCPSGRPFFFFFFFGKMPPKHVTEPRDCPCRPRAHEGFGSGLSYEGKGLVEGWSRFGSRPTLKTELDKKANTISLQGCVVAMLQSRTPKKGARPQLLKWGIPGTKVRLKRWSLLSYVKFSCAQRASCVIPGIYRYYVLYQH